MHPKIYCAFRYICLYLINVIYDINKDKIRMFNKCLLAIYIIIFNILKSIPILLQD